MPLDKSEGSVKGKDILRKFGEGNSGGNSGTEIRGQTELTPILTVARGPRLFRPETTQVFGGAAFCRCGQAFVLTQASQPQKARGVASFTHLRGCELMPD